jgi:stage II sporulation protein D
MASPLKKVISYKLWVIGLSFLLTHNYCYAQPPEYIRVLIIQDAKYLNLKIRGGYEITDPKKGILLSRGSNLKTTVTGSGDSILLGKDYFNTDKILLNTADQNVIIVDGRLFRGKIQLIKNKNGLFAAVNHIGLEDYIRGILYHEVSHYWPMEALKAQAIACRSYAAYQIQVSGFKDYDVTADVYSQVYGGFMSERYRTNKAVDQTQGKVLTYQGKVFPAYFHATCGGHTEDASLLWNINLAPLKGVVCDFCKDSPHFNWHYVLTLKEVKEKLSDAGYKIDKIKEIVVLGRDSSGRITDLKIASDKKDLKISAKDFRSIIGPDIIRSTNFNVNLVKNDAVFEGVGWGHGVGLCQWGAYFMAKNGFDAEQILKYYYPGSEIH